MAQYDITETNAAIDRLLEVTENPRHRFLLQSYHRHRFLEIAGRYQEIFVPEMTIAKPVYHCHVARMNTTLEGKDAIEGLYQRWAATNQSIFYSVIEQISVADNYVASMGIICRQMTGRTLAAAGFTVHDIDAMYLYKTLEETFWPYDNHCRLISEDVWEPEPEKAQLIKLHPADVLTTEDAARLLALHIKPLPPLDPAIISGAIPEEPQPGA